MFFGGAFPYGARSAFAFAVFMLATSPCISAIAASAKEVGKRRALLYAALQTGSALLLSYVTYFALSFGTACIFILPVPFAILILGKKTFENLRSKRKRNLKNVHR
jgi:4-hydroxybenzoate polyprenyltransferase